MDYGMMREQLMEKIEQLPEAAKAELDAAVEREYADLPVRNPNKPPLSKRRFGLKAFKLGWYAAHIGRNYTLAACPYPDKPSDMGVSWSRAYIRMWERGYKACKEGVGDVGNVD
jgi:hypothetical protein